MKARSLALVATLAIGAAAAAGAATVEFAFGGVVQSVQDDHAVLDGSIAIGTPLSGTARYDTTLPDAVGDPMLGEYNQSVPPGSFVVQVGNYTIAAPSLRLIVYDGFTFGGSDPTEAFDWRFEGDTVALPGGGGASLNQILFYIETEDFAVLASDDLPAAPLDFADFPNPGLTTFNITGCLDTELNGFICTPDETLRFNGRITSVPEPRATANALVALATLGCVARRFRPA